MQECLACFNAVDTNANQDWNRNQDGHDDTSTATNPGRRRVLGPQAANGRPYPASVAKAATENQAATEMKCCFFWFTFYLQCFLNMTSKPQLDLVLCFDTTGSMAGVLGSVRTELARLTATIFAHDGSHDVAVAVVAHGDYDSAAQYVTTHLDFSADAAVVTQWIRGVAPVCNTWNEGEAYEQALEVMKHLTWRVDSVKVVVLVGDDIPHAPHFPGNTAHTDWRECLAYLTAMNIAFYSIQCTHSDVDRCRDFYRSLGTAHARGRALLLDQFYIMPELIMGLFLHATDDTAALATHEADMVARGVYSRATAQAFDTMLNRASGTGPVSAGAAAGSGSGVSGSGAATRTTSAGRGQKRGRAASVPPLLSSASQALEPVPPGRFQRLHVQDAITIKDFVLAAGAIFKPGQGFYEISKPEEVSAKKEIILEDVATADMFTGAAARHMLHLPAGGAAVKIGPTDVPAGYRAYIQSTSNNRKLVGGTKFLYEVSVH